MCVDIQSINCPVPCLHDSIHSAIFHYVHCQLSPSQDSSVSWTLGRTSLNTCLLPLMASYLAPPPRATEHCLSINQTMSHSLFKLCRDFLAFRENPSSSPCGSSYMIQLQLIFLTSLVPLHFSPPAFFCSMNPLVPLFSGMLPHPLQTLFRLISSSGLSLKHLLLRDFHNSPLHIHSGTQSSSHDSVLLSLWRLPLSEIIVFSLLVLIPLFRM